MGSVQSDDVRQGTAAAFVRFLGSFEIVLPGDNPVELDSARARSLLAYLIQHRSAAVERQRLAFMLWQDSQEAQPLTAQPERR